MQEALACDRFPPEFRPGKKLPLGHSEFRIGSLLHNKNHWRTWTLEACFTPFLWKQVGKKGDTVHQLHQASKQQLQLISTEKSEKNSILKQIHQAWFGWPRSPTGLCILSQMLACGLVSWGWCFSVLNHSWWCWNQGDGSSRASVSKAGWELQTWPHTAW